MMCRSPAKKGVVELVSVTLNVDDNGPSLQSSPEHVCNLKSWAWSKPVCEGVNKDIYKHVRAYTGILVQSKLKHGFHSKAQYKNQLSVF